MLDAAQIVRLHDQANAHWHDPSAPPPQPDCPFAQIILDQHRANFDLWHCEDDARDPLASERTIVQRKHSIDTLNQRRNDLAERIDVILLEAAQAHLTQPRLSAEPPLHSETPGLIIDRLSILSLKVFHTAQEIERPAATPEHRDRNRGRLSVLNQQRDDLAFCLDELWAEVLAGRRRFKLYRQLKMYNDPSLNPVLYRKSAPSST